MKQFLFYLTLALLLPSAIAFNCNSLSGGDFNLCNEIQKEDITSSEKDLIISDLFNPNKTTPNFDFIYSWNTNLKFEKSPDGKEYSSGTINNAWIKIISLMPSIINNGTLYSSSNEKLLTAYNYKYTLPSGKERDDCKTVYQLENTVEDLNVYLNDNFIGKDKLISIIIPNQENLTFRAELNIQIRYKVTHYRKREINDRMQCVYYSIEHRTDNLKISDSLSAKLYKSNLKSDLKVLDKYDGVIKGNLTANNFTNLVLNFSNSSYQNYRYTYSLNYTLPYYILTLKAETSENINSKNIHVDKINNNFILTVFNASKCEIQMSDYFSSATRLCDLSFTKNNFSIKTDKTNYFENDTIKVYITPNNILVNLTYANQSILVKNYTEFKSVVYENKIKAKLNDSEITLLVNITNRNDFVFLRNIGTLSFIGYIFFKGAKVYFSTFPI